MPPDGWVGMIRLDDGEKSLGFYVEGKIYTLDTRTLSRCYESPHIHSYLRIFDTPIEQAVTKEGIVFRCENFYMEKE